MTEDVHDHRIQLVSSSYKILSRQFGKFGIRLSKKHNAVYGTNDLLDVLLTAGRLRTSVHESVNTMRIAAIEEAKKTGEPVRRTPSDDFVRESIKRVRQGQAQKWGDKQVAATLRLGRKKGMLRQIDTIGVDVNDREYYGRGMKGHVRRSASKNGTTKFISHISMRGLGHGCGLMLDTRKFVDKKKTPVLLRTMLRKIVRSGIRPRAVLMDREFCNVACMKAVESSGMGFITPAKKTPPIIRKIEEYVRGECGPITKYTMTGANGSSFTYNLVIVEKEPAKKKNESLEAAVKRCVVFATNVRYRSVKDMLERIPEEYRARWGIETAFRVIKSVAAMTTSNSATIRLLLFYLSIIVVNLWAIDQFYDAEYDWGGYAGGYGISVAIFMQYLLIAGSYVNDRGK